jgi:LmbE family N-acetylglucosaminyl deacetylase
MTEEARPMDPVPEDWSRALAVVAHPDDMEFGAASAVARWTAQGKWVGYCLVTAGEAGIDGMAPDEAAAVREDEQRRSSTVVGVDTVEFLGHPDGLVEASIELRRDIAAAIRRHRPEVIISLNFRDHWGGGGVNHADHRNVGWALLDAVRDAANRWLFPGVGGPPWSGVRFALFSGSPQATHVVDVADTLHLGVASLREHAAYLDGLGADSFAKDPERFLRGSAEATGASLGTGPAVTFELVGL